MRAIRTTVNTRPGHIARPGLALLLACVVALLSTPAPAQNAEPPRNEAGAPGISPASIRESLQNLEPRTDLDEAFRASLIEVYRRALATAEQAVQFEQQALQFEQLRQGVAGERETVERDLAQGFDATITIPPDATLETLRQQRDQAEAAVRDARERLTQVERDQAQRTDRRSAIPGEIVAARSALEDIESALGTPPPPDVHPELAAAEHAERLAGVRFQRAVIQAVSIELANYDARSELLPLRRQRATLRIEAREAQLQAWSSAVSEREAEAARLAGQDASPTVRAIAERNLELVERRTGVQGVLARTAGVKQGRERLEIALRRAAAQYERDRHRVEAATGTGLSDARLRTQRSDLTDPRELRGYLRRLRNELAETQRELADLEYERQNLPPARETIEAAIAEQPPDLEPAVREALRREVESIAGERRAQYDALISALREYESELEAIQNRLEPLLVLTQRYIEFIDERILWIRSTNAVGLREPGRIARTGVTLVAASSWSAYLDEAWRELRRRPWGVITGAVIFGVLLQLRRRAASRLPNLAERAGAIATDRAALGYKALTIALIQASTWPIVLWMFAWWHATTFEPTDLSRQIAAGCLGAAPWLLTTRFVMLATRDQALCDVHLKWRPATRAVIRRHLRWYEPVAVTTVFLMAAVEWETLATGTDPLARAAFVLLMGATALFAARLLRPGHGVAEGAVSRHRGEWLERAEYIWYPLSIAAPLALAFIALIGFFYTGLQFEGRLLATAQLLLGVTVLQGLVQRGLLVARRRLVMEEARRRREAAAEQAAKGGGAASAEGGIIKVEETKLDLVSIDTQAKQLLRTGVAVVLIVGLWLVWARMLPALGMLERIEIWPNFGAVRETATSVPTAAEILGPTLATEILRTPEIAAPLAPESAMPPPFASPAEPFSREDAARLAGADPPTPDGAVTLINVIIFFMVGLIAYAITRNAPGLLEITILQRLPMTPSGRYAVVTLTRYAIAVVGIVAAFGAIGIGWSQVQWLVAAITLGIGFGLQEIVANFISGIIILIERPIRVGDTVTVGGVSGNVTRIRMRATTITDWDRKELIIPNKTFITSDVINWTLSDQILRVVIPVGVAYGSDTQAAERTLLRLAAEHPCVLKDPAPSVVFSEFGDSSLTFNLRMFIPSISEMIRVRHEMHMAIDKAFRESGIEIAFPQRDIHIRGIEGFIPAMGTPPTHASPTSENPGDVKPS